jgi:hypothetical protein
MPRPLLRTRETNKYACTEVLQIILNFEAVVVITRGCVSENGWGSSNDGVLIWEGAGYRVTDGAFEKQPDPTYQLAVGLFFDLYGETVTNVISNGLVNKVCAAHV